MGEEEDFSFLGMSFDQGILLCSEIIAATMDSLEPKEQFNQSLG
jgi:hypothetical protein